MNRVPLSADELKTIAEQLARWNGLLLKDGDYTALADIVSRIEVHRPDVPGEVVGHFVLDDGWVGFQPVGGLFA